jgi:hypothetical protein
MRGLQGIQGLPGVQGILGYKGASLVTTVKEGFYGFITFINETTSNSYNYELRYKNDVISTETFTVDRESYNYFISVDNRLLRPYYEYNIQYYGFLFENKTPINNIEFSISGGTFRTGLISNTFKVFYFTADNNKINNGTLIIRSKFLQT